MELIASVKRQAIEILRNFIGDRYLGTGDVIYKLFVSQRFDRDLGYNVVTTSDSTISGVELCHTKESAEIVVNASDSVIDGDFTVQVGNKAFVFISDDLPLGMSLKDKIVKGSIVHPIKSITPIFEIACIITVGGSR